MKWLACWSMEEGPYCFFLDHPLNFKVTRAKKLAIWIDFSKILLGRSQLSNPLDLPCLIRHAANLLWQPLHAMWCLRDTLTHTWHDIICPPNFIDIWHDLTHTYKITACCCVAGCENRDRSFQFPSNDSLSWKWCVAIKESYGNGEFKPQILIPAVVP